jgi:hypothetical protein
MNEKMWPYPFLLIYFGDIFCCKKFILSNPDFWMEKESKLYRFLLSCSGYELRRFRVFLTSPFFNLRPEIVKAWDLIRPHFQQTESELPTVEAVFEVAYPGQSFDAGKSRHFQSELCKLLEEFWQLQQLQNRNELQDLLLLRSLHDRQLDQDFEFGMVRAQTQLLGQAQRGAPYLRQQFDLALLQHDHNVGRDNRSVQAGLQAAMEALDEEYFTHKLRLAAAAINRANVIGQSTDISLLAEVIALIDAAPPVTFEGSLVAIYRLVLRTLQSPKDHAAFEALLGLLQENSAHFPQSTLAELYAFALNYCVRMVNLAEPGFDAQLFALYQLLMEGSYLQEEGYLPVQHYKNFVTIGLRLGHVEEVSVQLLTLAKRLPPDIKANAVLFSQAALAFHLGDHGRALKLLQQVEFTDVYYHLDAKSLLLKAWYQLDDVEPLLSLIESFKTYLRRSRKISDYQRATYRNQIKVVQMMTRHRLGRRKPLQEIKSTVATLRPIADLAWLERMVEELG